MQLLNQTLFPHFSISTFRKQLLFLLAISLSMIIVSIFFERIIGLHNCHLCIFQRIIAMSFAVVTVILLIHSPNGWQRRAYSLLMMMIAALGMVFAGRHAWIQYFQSSKITNCDPSLSVLVERLPITTLIERVFFGNGECAESFTTFLGLNIPTWSLLVFTFLYLYSLKLVIKNQ